MRQACKRSAVDCTVEQAKNSCAQLAGDAVSSPTQPLVVYVDVDDTFVRSVGAKRIPITRTIEHVRQLHARGALLYCWSSGGSEYARKSAEEFGIEQCFQAFLPKPNVLVDDQTVAEWRLCLEVHPLTVKHETPEQYWEEIKNKK